MLDKTAAQVAISRLRRIAWGHSDPYRQGSRLALLREYLRRAARAAQALDALGLGGGGWPWLDAAAQLTRPGREPGPVPDVAASTLPGYVFLDAAPHYRGPGTDPLEDEVLAMSQEQNGQPLTPYMRSTCLFYVRWEALKNHPAVQALALPDLYEPLVQFYERGGWFRMEHGDYIELGDTLMVGRGSAASNAQRAALPSLAPAVLDELDRIYTRQRLDELLARLLQSAAAELRAHGAALPPPATEATLALLQAQAWVALELPVPAGYLVLLRLADGLSWADLRIYGSGLPPAAPAPPHLAASFAPGCVAANLARRQATPAAAHQLVLAEDQDLLYGYDPAAEAAPYLAYERAGGAVAKRFGWAEELLGHALQKRVWAAEKARRDQR